MLAFLLSKDLDEQDDQGGLSPKKSLSINKVICFVTLGGVVFGLMGKIPELEEIIFNSSLSALGLLIWALGASKRPKLWSNVALSGFEGVWLGLAIVLDNKRWGFILGFLTALFLEGLLNKYHFRYSKEK